VVGFNCGFGRALRSKMSASVSDGEWTEGWEVTHTRSFWVMPFSIFWSHWGVLPFSVANWTSKPAFLNAAYGTAVSADRLALSMSDDEVLRTGTCWVVPIV
jgi:hypothetical protein